ncbi:hypothetical protein HAX54_011002, partial [Datura stramonium]|nr:hypothetical protein [Datura stramonium]
EIQYLPVLGALPHRLPHCRVQCRIAHANWPRRKLLRACLHALCRTGRPAPCSWNRRAQGPRRTSGSTTRPVPRASGHSAVLCSAICLALCIIHSNFLIFIP